MKKNLWIWALAALSMSACTSEDAPSQDQVVTENDFEGPDGRIVVQLGAESTPAAIVSRAVGPVEGKNILALTDLGIFAVDRTRTIEDDDITSWPTIIDKCLLMNVKAEGAKATEDNNYDKDNENDNTLDPLDKDVNDGKKITLYDTEASGAHAVYYYPMQGKQNYDFYGYHPRVSSDNISTMDGKVTITNTLDGNIDLITGAAKKAPQVDEGDIYVTEHAGTTAPGKGAASVKIDGYNAKYVRKIKYSNWIIDEWNKTLAEGATLLTGKKPFVPMISFKHRLTKLNFQIITAEEQAGPGAQNPNGDRLDATKLRVNTVKLHNVFKDVTMTLNRNAETEEPEVSLAFATTGELPMIPTNKTDRVNVWDFDEGAAWTETTNIKPQEYDEDKSTYKDAGYLMVPATNDVKNLREYKPYVITLNVVAASEIGVPQTQAITLEMPEGTTFEAGKSYNIRIALYAQQEVFVSAELTDWVEDENGVDIPVE